MTMSYEALNTNQFSHPKEITHGAARELYVEPFGQLGRWVLPGGTHTNDPAEARVAAILVNDLIEANTPRVLAKIAQSWPS
jgi:hypothetical protein